MTIESTQPSRFVLPLPSFVLHRYTAVVLAVIHIYLSIGHLSKLFGGPCILDRLLEGLW